MPLKPSHFVALLLLLIGALPARAAQSPGDSGGITDAQIREVIQRVANHQIRALADGAYPLVTNLDEAKDAQSPEGIAWNYPWGVALYGMESTAEAAEDKAADKFVADHDCICSRYYVWLDGLQKQFGNPAKSFGRATRLKGLVSLGNLDSCGAMGTQMLASMMRHPEQVIPQEKTVVNRIADWVANRQDRLPDGTLWRSRQMGGTVWPDDLYMGGVFLAWWSRYTGEPRYADDAASNIIHQATLEQDTDGLWFHGYVMSEKRHAPFKWGRGNGWAMVATVEALSAMAPEDPLRPPLREILRKQAGGLKKVQAPDGMWRQVLDKPELWEETSCTAMFTYSLARAANRGWIAPDYLVIARRAFAALSRRVSEDGAVRGTCQGTNIGRTLDYYIQRQRPEDDPHGPGPLMLAGAELLRSGL